MLTVNKHGGIGCEQVEVFHFHRGTLIYSTVLTGHIGEHRHVAVPRCPSLQKANIYWLIHKHPTVNSLSTLRCNRSGKILLLKNIEVFLTFSWVIVISETMFPLPWQWSSTESPSLILPFGDSTQTLMAVEGSRTERATQHHPHALVRQRAPRRCLRASQSDQQTVSTSPGNKCGFPTVKK